MKRKGAIQEFIRKLKILKKQGIDITKIAQRDTIQTLAEKSGVVITEKQAEELGIKLSDKIGTTRTYIVRAYRGKGTGKKPTQEQVDELRKLGINFEEKNTTQEFIEKLKILKIQKIDVEKITTTDTIQTLAERSGVIITEEQAKELGIELSDKIGGTKHGIACAYRGKGTLRKPTQEQVQELRDLGISLEKRDSIQKFIEKLKILKKQGIKITKMTNRDTIETLAEKSGVIITKEMAEELGIRLNDRIGVTKMNIVRACRRGAKNSEQVQELQNLGIRIKFKDVTQEFIEKIEILKEHKIDVTKITFKDTIQTLAEKSAVVITKEKAEELGIELSDKIGQTKVNIARAYREYENRKKPTQEQVKRLLELGISLEKVRRTGKEIARASIGSIKHMEISDKADKELQELVKEVQKEK